MIDRTGEGGNDRGGSSGQRHAAGRGGGNLEGADMRDCDAPPVSA